MDEVVKKFLLRLRDGGPLCLASRADDRTRQKARRAGWAVFCRTLRTWIITPAGEAALKAEGGE